MLGGFLLFILKVTGFFGAQGKEQKQQAQNCNTDTEEKRKVFRHLIIQRFADIARKIRQKRDAELFRQVFVPKIPCPGQEHEQADRENSLDQAALQILSTREPLNMQWPNGVIHYGKTT